MTRRLWALSDVHLRYPPNREALARVEAHPGDWLILAGDIGEEFEHLTYAIDTLAPKFERLLWVPGNHELWTRPSKANEPKGVARYDAFVALCRERGVLTPEDEYVRWPDDASLVLAPLFLLYDYSFVPEGISPENAVAWAAEEGIVCTDEALLAPEPYPSRAAWCAARCEATEQRLRAIPEGCRTVLINHFPLREDLIFIPRVPRFVPWCGTKRTEDWHQRFRAEVVVSGHLHVRSTKWRDGVRFEEVSLGYPGQFDDAVGGERYLREILPGAPVNDSGDTYLIRPKPLRADD